MSEHKQTTDCVPALFLSFAGLDPSAEIVVCTPFRDIAEYQGTRAALEAEGVIPAGTDWPEAFNDLHWDDGKFHYWLRRERPEGQKGPRRQFIGVDWWMLRCEPLYSKSIEAREVERKKKELAEYIHRNTPAGRAASDRQWGRYWESQKDKPFQAFKASCGIAVRRRGRPRKCEEPAQGAKP
jgi:hypothetical protein